ncbi:MAG: SMC-Scp complex subunit ScpB [Candidatus Pacearchaeota archaeon]
MELTKETQSEIDDAKDIENLKKVEAALFISGKFISLQELVSLTDLNPILLNHTLNLLKEKYDDNSAIEIINKNDLWKMDVKNEFYYITTKLASGNKEFSRAEQETLAIIAHKQPIKQSEIISIRGNKAYEHIKKFVELNLVLSKRKGKTYELSLSDEFYNYFSIKKKEKIFKNVEENIEGNLKITEKKEADKNTEK